MSSTLVSDGREAEHYAEASNWEADRSSRLEQSEKRAWRVAIGASVTAVAAVIGIASLAPFKSVVPYVFTVDKATGNVELVSAADDRQMVGYQELNDKHWAQRYVVARESYYWSLLQSDYDTVLRLSSDDVGRDYAHIYDGEEARDKKFGSSIEMRVKVLSVGVARDAVGSRATVRFEKSAKRTQSDRPDPPQYFVATLAFEYKPSMKGKEVDLVQNPLGFKVISYRVDSELAPVAPLSNGTGASSSSL